MRDRYRLPDSLRDVMRHVAAVAIAIAATCRRKPTETSLNYSSTMQVSHPCRMLAHVCAPRLLSLTLHTYIRTHRALPPRIRSPSLPLAHVLTAGRFRVVAGQEWSGEQMDAMDVCNDAALHAGCGDEAATLLMQERRPQQRHPAVLHYRMHHR